MSELFAGIYERGRAAEEVSDRGWLQAMLDVEAALGGDSLRAESLDLSELGSEAASHASPVVPLAKLFPDTHAGATSQDVLDTAMMLVASRARTWLLEDASAAANAAARLADTHRSTPVMGQTLLRKALPTSLGLRAAGWTVAIDQARSLLARCELPVQMGGPVGHRDPDETSEVATALGLTHPVTPWHTNRIAPAALASALGMIAGTLAKVARDVILTPGLEEGAPGRGLSSSIPGKRNPVACISVLACARRTPGLVATMLGLMEQEHERAAGSWQAEWGTMTELVRLTGSTAAWALDLLENLEVDPDALRVGAEGIRSGSLGASSELIDRALAAHRESC